MSELATGGPAPAPVAAGERVLALDVLRGVAVLGILVMNVQSFALPFAAYSNPGVWTDRGTLDVAFWAFAHVFAEQKFMTLFSLLFGSGVALMLERLEARGAPAASIHYRRSAGLLLIGLAHAYLLWYGDILVSYALCALALYPLRRVRPKRLLVAGLVLLCVAPLISQGFMAGLRYAPPAERAEALAQFVPPEEDVLHEVEAFRGGWREQMTVRAELAATLQTFGFGVFVLWRAGGLMLIGMALYKWGLVTAARPPDVYRRLALWGFGLGLPLVLAGLAVDLVYRFDFQAMWFTNGVLNYLGSAGLALGYLALVMLWCLSRPAGAVMHRLAAVGRMALTNYLLQTILGVLVFYGTGLGLFGEVGRAAQWLFVLAVWAFELWLSRWWLERFRFGPFEWLWRTMTYLRPQPMRRPTPPAAAARPSGSVQ
jgi:uncharacterized protein